VEEASGRGLPREGRRQAGRQSKKSVRVPLLLRIGLDLRVVLEKASLSPKSKEKMCLSVILIFVSFVGCLGQATSIILSPKVGVVITHWIMPSVLVHTVTVQRETVTTRSHLLGTTHQVNLGLEDGKSLGHITYRSLWTKKRYK
jgi:hypothetical protein